MGFFVLVLLFGVLQTIYRLQYIVLYRFATSAALDLDDSDDFGGHGLQLLLFNQFKVKVGSSVAEAL